MLASDLRVFEVNMLALEGEVLVPIAAFFGAALFGYLTMLMNWLFLYLFWFSRHLEVYLLLLVIVL